jgi:hypothetical protein
MFDKKTTRRFKDVASVLKWARQLSSLRSAMRDGPTPDGWVQRPLKDYEVGASEGRQYGIDFARAFFILPDKYRDASTSNPDRGTAINSLTLYFNPPGVKKIPSV